VIGTPELTIERIADQVAEAREHGFAWTLGERVPHASRSLRPYAAKTDVLSAPSRFPVRTAGSTPHSCRR
jgi:hypothetical protein